MELKLVIGNKNLSSWSLRPWLALKHVGAAFEELMIPLDKPTTREQILRYSPAGRVPILFDGPVAIWDSLAICEYLAEKFPYAELWPLDPILRAQARSVSAEMHSGFASLRQQLPMNLAKKVACPDLRPDTLSDIRRIETIWKHCLQKSGGPFLFGAFTIADAMYAPVVTRFASYSVPIDRELELYSLAITQLPAMRQWANAALEEVSAPL